MQIIKVNRFLNSMHEGEKKIIYNTIAMGIAKDQFTIWEVSERYFSLCIQIWEVSERSDSKKCHFWLD